MYIIGFTDEIQLFTASVVSPIPCWYHMYTIRVWTVIYGPSMSR